ncbi:MAG: M42 family metallopeptidase [Anaerolineae bacterium]|jgi:endoglucanase|nr:M42 family metallopeptidase [Anaerolineae bacterium]
MEFLKDLSEAIGVSGKEDAVRAIVLNAIANHVENIQIDPMGNVTALKPGVGDGPRLRVMFAAHMDEVGFMVTGIDSDGLIRFTGVGSVDDRILPGLRVRVGDDALPGVILWTPIHLNHEQRVVKLKDLRIDIGGNKDDTNSKVKRGDRIGFDSRFMEIGDRVLRGKSFDDRVGCSLLIDVLRGGPYPVDLIAVFTVQEEIGLRGAQVAAQTLTPDVAFALEGTTAHDLPNPLADLDSDEVINPTCRLGGGPVLTVLDRSVIVPPQLLGFLRATAEQHQIPYQLKTQPGGGTDAGAIHITNGGVPSAVISMPCRYIHSPTALLNRDDYQHTLRLLQAVLASITVSDRNPR